MTNRDTILVTAALLLTLSGGVVAQGGRAGGAAPAPPPTARTVAPIAEMTSNASKTLKDGALKAS